MRATHNQWAAGSRAVDEALSQLDWKPAEISTEFVSPRPLQSLVRIILLLGQRN